jgi:hypothetical protein
MSETSGGEFLRNALQANVTDRNRIASVLSGETVSSNEAAQANADVAPQKATDRSQGHGSVPKPNPEATFARAMYDLAGTNRSPWQMSKGVNF